MTMKNLTKQLTGLVADFGYDRVHKTLSEICHAKPQMVKHSNPAPKRGKINRKPRSKPDAISTVAAMDVGDSDKKFFLEQLAEKYENKEFMPNVNHVRTFLMYECEDPAKIKSRQQVTVKVFKKMAEMSLEDLRELKYCGMYDPPKRLETYARAIENYGREVRAARHSRD